MLGDVDSSWPTVFGTVNNEANVRLDRTTGEKLYLSIDVRIFFAEQLQNICQRAFLRGHINDNAHRTSFVVAHDQYYSMIEVGISKRGRRDQKLTGKRNMY